MKLLTIGTFIMGIGLGVIASGIFIHYQNNNSQGTDEGTYTQEDISKATIHGFQIAQVMLRYQLLNDTMTLPIRDEYNIVVPAHKINVQDSMTQIRVGPHSSYGHGHEIEGWHTTGSLNAGWGPYNPQAKEIK